MTSLNDLPKDILIKLLTTIQNDLEEKHNKKMYNLAHHMCSYHITGDNVITDYCCANGCDAINIRKNDYTATIIYSSAKHFTRCHCCNKDDYIYCSDHYDQLKEHFMDKHKYEN